MLRRSLLSGLVLAGAATPAAAAATTPAAPSPAILGVLAEPFDGPGGRHIDPLPHDGLNAWLSTISRFEQTSGARLRIVLRFRPWGDALVNRDDQRLLARGLEPMLSLTPTSTMTIGMIARGRGDAWLRLQARRLQLQLTRASKTRHEELHAFIRFAHEMNGDWYAWGAPRGTPNRARLYAAQATYRAAFRRVANIVHKEAPSVQLVWAANRSSTPAVAANDLLRWYPGDAAADWIAVDGYNRNPTGWRTPTVLFDAFRVRWARSYRTIAGDPKATHRANARPLMIAETSTIDVPAKRSAHSPTDATWIAQLHAYLARHHEFRALIWFDRAKRCSDKSHSMTCHVVDWNPPDGVRTKTLPWDWNSTRTGAAAFRPLVQDAALFAPGPR